ERRSEWRNIAPRRPSFEFLLEFVIGEAGLEVALGGITEKLRIELSLGRIALPSGVGAACAINATKIAVNDGDGLRLRFRSPSARRAWLPLEPDCTTFRAVTESRCLACLPRALGDILDPPVFLQRPDNRIVWKSVSVHSAGMINENAVL